MFQRTRCVTRSVRRKYSVESSAKAWKSVVGLEVHAQINSKSKLFSGALNEFANPVNTNVSLFDCAIPGTLPVLNKKCVELGVLTALALNCKINPVSLFDRKHYFYADIPAGYQITQQRSPLAIDGVLEFQVYTPGVHKKPYVAKAKIKQIQLEQDSGKSLHEDDRSLVDLNRAGAPLMEIVFEPDLVDGEEASALIKELTIILQRLGSCTCKMEEGALRVDANISIHRQGKPFGIRTEVKNIGSVRGVAGAVKYEIERQIEVVENGGSISNETRAWDAVLKKTLPMRDKEIQQDYRYMPEPNLPPLHVALSPLNRGVVKVNNLEKILPELPEQTRTRLKENYKLTPEQAIILVSESKLLQLFEDIVKYGTVSDYKLVANIIINDLIAILNKEKKEVENLMVNGLIMNDIIELIKTGTINRKTSKSLLREIVLGNRNTPLKIVTDNNWMQINNDVQIEAICSEIIKQNELAVKQYKKGKKKVFKALMGAVAQQGNRPINMEKADQILKQLLNN